MLITEPIFKNGAASLNVFEEFPPLDPMYSDDPMMAAEEGYVPFQDDLMDEEYEPDVVNSYVQASEYAFDDDLYDDDQVEMDMEPML